MIEPFNGLTPAQAERLAVFIEECGEAVQAACKVLRHGYESVDPTLEAHEQKTNRQALGKEMGDIFAAMIMLCEHNDIPEEVVPFHAGEKLESVKQWLHHQGES